VIPTSLTGLFLFLVALLPGFIFLVLREQHRPSKKLSPLRETATVLLVSILSYVPVLIAVVVLAFFWPSFNAGLGGAFSNLDQYQELHAYRLAATVASAVLIGSGVAALCGWRLVSNKKVDPGASAWWQILSADGNNAPEATRRVTVFLKDGGALVGNLKSFSRDAEEHADRDLVLQSPLFYQGPVSKEYSTLDGAAVIVSAREVQFLEVLLIETVEGQPVEEETTGVPSSPSPAA
jgi:hypothetical protein